MRGVASGSLIAYLISITVMGWYLFSGRARVVPRVRGLRIRRAMFMDILKVGAVSCFSPLQSVLTISIFTHMLAGFGTAILAGYGIGARLEFMLTSVAFATGIASVPMIGMAIGAGRIARATDRLDRGLDLVRFSRIDRHLDRDLPRPVGQYLH
jgi:Na+-driven multidrug efflux pump